MFLFFLFVTTRPLKIHKSKLVFIFSAFCATSFQGFCCISPTLNVCDLLPEKCQKISKVWSQEKSDPNSRFFFSLKHFPAEDVSGDQ